MGTRVHNQATELPNGFPADNADHHYPAAAGRAQMPEDRDDGVNERAGRPSRKASYALALQRACDTAGERVKSNNMIANSNWASPLASAPSAISTMAILFKVADRDCAHGLEVASQDVMDVENNTVKGRLP
jgi:hypothetical protein